MVEYLRMNGHYSAGQQVVGEGRNFALGKMLLK